MSMNAASSKEFEREAWLAVREAVLAGGDYRAVAKYYGLQYKLSGAEAAVSCVTPKRPGLLADALLWMVNDFYPLPRETD